MWIGANPMDTTTWFVWQSESNSDAILIDRILYAASHYERKFGQCPNLAQVNPAMLDGSESAGGPIRITTASHILPNHIYLTYIPQPTADTLTPTDTTPQPAANPRQLELFAR
jgi:hypothetical protein